MEALVTIIIAIVVLFAAVMTAVFWLAPRPLLDSWPPGTQVPASLGPVELETWLTEHEARYAGSSTAPMPESTGQPNQVLLTFASFTSMGSLPADRR